MCFQKPIRGRWKELKCFRGERRKRMSRAESFCEKKENGSFWKTYPNISHLGGKYFRTILPHLQPAMMKNEKSKFEKIAYAFGGKNGQGQIGRRQSKTGRKPPFTTEWRFLVGGLECSYHRKWGCDRKLPQLWEHCLQMKVKVLFKEVRVLFAKWKWKFFLTNKSESSV